MQEPTKTGRQTPKGDVEGAKLRTMSSQGRARPEPMVKYSDGAADNMYREVIHTSPKKMENMSKVVSGNKSFNLDYLSPEKREELELVLQSKDEEQAGRCYCGYCNCGKHKCPSRVVRCKYPSQYRTRYQQDYMGRASDVHGDDYNPNKRRRTSAAHKLDGVSTYKNDFLPQATGMPERHTCPKTITANGPFAGSSAYQNQFPNWGVSNGVSSQKPRQTHYSMPFKGQSSYQSTYVPVDLRHRGRPLPAAASIKSNGKFSGVTSKMVDFKPFKIVPTKSAAGRKQASISFSYPGQYVTTAQECFRGQQPIVDCACGRMQKPIDFTHTATYYNPTQNEYYVS